MKFFSARPNPRSRAKLGDSEELIVGRIAEIDDLDPVLAFGGDRGHGLTLVTKLLEHVVAKNILLSPHHCLLNIVL